MAIAVRCGGRKAPLVPQDDVDNTDRAGNHGRSRAVGIGSRNIIGCDLAAAHWVRNRVDSGLRNRHGRGVLAGISLALVYVRAAVERI